MPFKKITNIPEIDMVANALSNKFKKPLFSLGPRFESVETVSTGSLSLDCQLGVGGVPIDRIIEIYGPESAGKTSLGLQIMRQYVDKYGYDRPPVFIDLERTTGLDLIAGMGLDPKKILFSYPDNSEEALQIAKDIGNSGAAGVIMFDSIDAAQAEEDANKTIAKAKDSVGNLAKEMSVAMRSLSKICTDRKVLYLMINQIRMKIMTYGNPETTCVTPETQVEFCVGKKKKSFGSMEQLFKSAGYDYKSMPINEPVDISNKNLYIRSFSHEKNETEFSKVTHLIRKEDSPIWEVRLPGENTVLLSGSGFHYIWDEEHSAYKQLSEMDQPVKLRLSNGQTTLGEAYQTERIAPILDISVEGNHNYFSNGILSKNSGGNALRYYASVRLRVESRPSKDVAGALRMKVKIIKNKVAPALSNAAEFDFICARGTDVVSDLIDHARDIGAIRYGGSCTYVSFLEEEEEQQISSNGGKDGALAFIGSNPEFYQKLREDCLKRARISRGGEVSKEDATDDPEPEPKRKRGKKSGKSDESTSGGDQQSSEPTPE